DRRARAVLISFGLLPVSPARWRNLCPHAHPASDVAVFAGNDPHRRARGAGNVAAHIAGAESAVAGGGRRRVGVLVLPSARIVTAAGLSGVGVMPAGAALTRVSVPAPLRTVLRPLHRIRRQSRSSGDTLRARV